MAWPRSVQNSDPPVVPEAICRITLNVALFATHVEDSSNLGETALTTANTSADAAVVNEPRVVAVTVLPAVAADRGDDALRRTGSGAGHERGGFEVVERLRNHGNEVGPGWSPPTPRTSRAGRPFPCAR